MCKTMRTTSSKDLPYDVVVDILSRLPVKTLMRLRCVCKSWYALITNPTFISMHLNRQYSYSNNTDYLQYLNMGSYSRSQVWCLLCTQTNVHHVELEIPFGSQPLGFSLLGTFNGLSCLYSTIDSGCTLFLWNPSIRKSKILPSSSSTFPPSQLSDCKNYVVLGFGFHPQTNDYKIVRFLYCRYFFCEVIANSPPLIEVYSLSTNSWSRIETHLPCLTTYPGSSAFLNGSIHWVSSKSGVNWDERDMIMSFDIGDEVFGEMMLPNYFIAGFGKLNLTLAVLKESLSLCVCFGGSGHCDIWVMKEYGVAESWTKQFTIEMPQGRIQRPLGFTMNNELLLEMKNRKLVSYNLGNLQHKDLGIRGALFTSNVFPFMETLVLL